MKITNNNLNFKGYKNFIGCDLQIPNTNSSLTVMALQLDNNGTRDLDAYRELRSLMGYKGKELDNDVIHCMYSEVPSGKLFFVNGKSLCDGNELKQLSKHIERSDFIIEEKAHLKAYTLLASLTRRIMNNGLMHIDAQMNNVLENSFNLFKGMFGNDWEIGAHLLQECAHSQQKPDKIAIKINHAIEKAMLNYFK